MQKQGFTLLELIIVVIIIGILASLALPQYAKVREKATAAEGVSILGAVRSAQFRYYTEYGVYASTLSALDTTFPESNNFYAPTARSGDVPGGDLCIGGIFRKGSLYWLLIGINGRIFCAPGLQPCPSGIPPYVGESCS